MAAAAVPEERQWEVVEVAVHQLEAEEAEAAECAGDDEAASPGHASPSFHLPTTSHRPSEPKPNSGERRSTDRPALRPLEPQIYERQRVPLA